MLKTPLLPLLLFALAALSAPQGAGAVAPKKVKGASVAKPATGGGGGGKGPKLPPGARVLSGEEAAAFKLPAGARVLNVADGDAGFVDIGSDGLPVQGGRGGGKSGGGKSGGGSGSGKSGGGKGDGGGAPAGGALNEFLAAVTGRPLSERPTAGAIQCLDRLAGSPQMQQGLRQDPQGRRAGESPAAFVVRTATETHPESAPLLGCLLAAGEVDAAFLRAPENARLLLPAAARLTAATPGDPTLLLRAMLEAGAPADISLAGLGLAGDAAAAAAAAAEGAPGATLLHKALSRDKLVMGGDWASEPYSSQRSQRPSVGSRLLRPNAPDSPFARFFVAMADNVASKLGAAAAKAVKTAARALIAEADVMRPNASAALGAAAGGGVEAPIAGDGAAAGGGPGAPSRSPTLLGRSVAQRHVQAIYNGVAELAVRAVLRHVRHQRTDAGGGAAGAARLAMRQDGLGRSALHAAVLGDNAGAVAALLAELKAAAAGQESESEDEAEGQGEPGAAAGAGKGEEPLAAAAAASLSSVSASAAGSGALARALAQKDVFGYTPRQLALALAAPASALLLAASEAAAGLDSSAAAGGELPAWPAAAAAAAPAAAARPLAAAPLVRNYERRGFARVPPATAEVAAAVGDEKEEEEDDGGWVAADYRPAASRGALEVVGAERSTDGAGGCDVDVIDFRLLCGAEASAEAYNACVEATLPPAEFARRFLVPRRPVLLRGAAARWRERASWRLEALLADLGHVELNIIPPPNPSVDARKRLNVSQHALGLLRCTPAMAAGDEPVPAGLGLDAGICRVLVGPGEGDGRFDSDAGAGGYGDPGGGAAEGGARAGGANASEGVSRRQPYLFDRIQDGSVSSSPLLRIMRSPPPFLDAQLPHLPGVAAVPPYGEPTEVAPSWAACTPVNTAFYLGGAGYGLSFHYHRDAANVLVFGAKRWLLREPRDAEYSNVLVTDFVRTLIPGGARPPALQCDQRQGDVFYVPRNWGHAVINTRTSVGYAVEFSSQRTYRYPHGGALRAPL